MIRLLELIVLFIAILSPFYYQANSLKDGDEVSKTTLGLIQVGALAAIFKGYQIWNNNQFCKKCGKKNNKL